MLIYIGVANHGGPRINLVEDTGAPLFNRTSGILVNP